jgi:glyceraldehyde-3-phosphate dehydrogenase (NAD(P))
MNVLVNGIGNIGTTLISVLQNYKKELGITEVYALKNSPMPWHKEDLEYLSSNGIKICTRNDNDSFLSLEKIIDKVDYIFDCTNNGGGLANKKWYTELQNLKGASAQGSEKNFGISFMSGINNEVLKGTKFAHIVSCNTHSIASLLTTFAGIDLENMKWADFVIVRRSEDLGNHQRLVSANVVARHLDDKLGTHHSIDVLDLFKTIGKSFRVSSSDITTPSQLMHGVRFNIKLKNPPSSEELDDMISKNPLMSSSTKFDSNVIFERGRRISPQGRIYSHAIVISNNILQADNRIMGWAFIPQEGNTILSTIHAFLLQTNHASEQIVMETIIGEMIIKKW